MKVPTYLLSQPILKMFKQNTHQMKMFEISIFLAFFTENLVKLHLKFVEQCPIDQNARSSCEVTLSGDLFVRDVISKPPIRTGLDSSHFQAFAELKSSPILIKRTFSKVTDTEVETGLDKNC